QSYVSKVQFQFRNLPLTTIHRNAFVGARAAEAADIQGKFWEMHNLLYQKQDPNGQTGWVASQDPLNDYFVGFAEQLKLDVDKFKTDFASTTVNDRINADIAAFKETGEQQATPTFFLNGKKIDNGELLEQNEAGQAVPSYDKFSAMLDKALADNK
ncbi:thioredoxin domain-containing protein, partial [Candidatus Saccharibacteria bacterium]|nr:thioredoxin domain-containing protein [Candidatus Saccharibacteria bacterium]